MGVNLLNDTDERMEGDIVHEQINFFFNAPCAFLH